MNILWGDSAQAPYTSKDRRRFEMAIGDQVSIVVYQAPDGSFGGDKVPENGGPTMIAIEAEKVTEGEEPTSVHYEPPGGDIQQGKSGELHFKIAVLRAKDDTHPEPWLEMFLAGSNIYVFRDLPMLENVGGTGSVGTGRVFKKYDAESNKYQLRAISRGAGTQIQVNENADFVEIRGNDKSASLIIEQETDASPVELLRWKFDDGLSVEKSDKKVTIPKSAATTGASGIINFLDGCGESPSILLSLTVVKGGITEINGYSGDSGTINIVIPSCSEVYGT